MASYQYEQLNDESFQQLSQSLLIKEFPGLQCFPVGQPDGGRDAIVHLFEATSDATGFILFQVKFARRELSPSEAREWLLRTLKGELPKVLAQITEGAKRFVLITNVSGTGHPETGSIDKLQALLEEHIPIPAQAWWRDDLDRRLDGEWDLKFAYPVLFSGADLLRLVVEQGSNEDRERRRNTIKAFLTGQFASDRDVKFKQVELENDILELFTDVPVVPLNSAGRNTREFERLEAAFHRVAKSASGKVDYRRIRLWIETASGIERTLENYRWREETWLGAASLLLDRDFQEASPQVLLEGAPGQGKSTISQYICQVHRMRFLETPEHKAIDPAHLASPLRLPFKVELRDFATWLSGGNPFGKLTNSDLPHEATRSLESFLSALVRYASGGAAFDVSDLHTILSSSPVLIVLDGLDEVAEINQRERVVEEITIGTSRLGILAKSLQVLVTSRPTPFTNSPALPRHTFASYSLESLTRPLITEYANRWLKSRPIGIVEAEEVRRILETKLDEPHLRDLARNPMQLAILLSLIHRRGASLPDERTALYDTYVEIFFDRESEKATVVRDNRELLIRIHRYLAWILHASAEVDAGSPSDIQMPGIPLSGRIAEEQLKELLQQFLEKDGSDPALVGQLFSGMVERVVAIVSRVKGTYEFDVQTLREYFAARHLYQTAHYSPPGAVRRGTISDRWYALSRNFYWLNVARFYAGCYSEGELASLVDDLHDLSEDESFRCTNHSQLLIATLLGDRVFSQRPRSSEAAVDLLVGPRGLRMLVASGGSAPRQTENVIVRDRAGRNRLIASCKELVISDLTMDRVVEIVRNVVRPNSEPEEWIDWWIEKLRAADESQADSLCFLGELLECWDVVDYDTVINLLEHADVPSSSVIAGLLFANRMDVLETTEELFDTAVQAVLGGDMVGRANASSLLQLLGKSLDLPFLGGEDLRSTFRRRMSLIDYSRESFSEVEITRPSYPMAERCTRLIQAITRAAALPLQEWNASIKPWEEIIQQGVVEFGERKRFVEMANVAAGIRSIGEKCEDSPDLFDMSRPLARRARYARRRAGVPRWWSNQLHSAKSADEIWMALLLFATWAGTKTFQELAEEFDKLIVNLPTSDWDALYSSLERVASPDVVSSWITSLRICVSALPSSLSARTVSILAERCTPETRDELYERYLVDYRDDDPIIASLRSDVLVRRALADETKWPQAIKELKTSYSLGMGVSRALIELRRPGFALPHAVAAEVADHPTEFPAILVWAAEARCRQVATTRILPVGRVAVEEGWFAD